MKKVFFVFLIFILVLGFAACEDEVVKDPIEDPVVDPIEDKPSSYSILDEDLESYAKKELVKAEVIDEGLLAPIQHGTGDWGYINILGKWIIYPYYSKVAPFSGDYGAYVDIFSGYIMINRTGKEYIKGYAGYNLNEATHYWDNMLLLSLASTGDQTYMYVNEYFRVNFNASKFPKVSGRVYKDETKFALATPFNNGKAVAMRYANAKISDGYDEECAYVFDHYGNISAALPKGLDITLLGIDDNDRIIVIDPKTNLYGLCDSSGSLVVECKYRNIKYCEGPYYLVCSQKGFLGYIDKDGNNLTDTIYTNALPFSEGLAAVYNGNAWGFIDENGKLVCDYVFDAVSGFKKYNLDVGSTKAAFSCGVAAVSLNGYWLLVDKEFKILFALDSTSCEGISCPFTACYNNYVIYCRNIDGTIWYGVLNNKGEEVLKTEYYCLDIFN